MRRRNFIFGGVALTGALTAAVTSPWLDWEEWLEDWNRLAFREELRSLAERGHIPKMCVLDPPRGGLRRVVVYTESGETVSWRQPWL